MSFEATEVVQGTCSAYRGGSGVNFMFLLLLIVGIIISYLPQYQRINQKRTSEGLSTSYLLLGSCSSIFTFTNIFLISTNARKCCFSGKLSLFDCMSSLVNLVQIGTQSACALLILVLLVLLTRHSVRQDKEEYSRIIGVSHIVIIHAVISTIEVIVGLSSKPSLSVGIASFNGLCSALLTMMKYVPQIYTTYKLKHTGTLSLHMMYIQTPGGVLFAMTIMMTKGSHWSSWISYLIACTLQGVLLSLGVYYEHFRNDGVTAELLERREIDRLVDDNRGQDDVI